jgi:hypothetical protein
MDLRMLRRFILLGCSYQIDIIMLSGVRGQAAEGRLRRVKPAEACVTGGSGERSRSDLSRPL